MKVWILSCIPSGAPSDDAEVIGVYDSKDKIRAAIQDRTGETKVTQRLLAEHDLWTYAKTVQ